MTLTFRKKQSASDLFDPESGLSGCVRTIYPHEAQAIIDGQIKNRNISRNTVKKYAKVFKAGKWVLNGEPIIFNGNTLIDGQHRLMACVETEVPFRVLCVYLTNDDAFRTLDQGKKRGGSDILSIAGYTNVTNIASSLAVLVKIDQDGFIAPGVGGSTRATIGNEEIEEVAKAYPGLEQSCAKAQSLYKRLRLKKSAIASLHYLLRRVEGKNLDFEVTDSCADIFLERVFTGVNLSANTPELIYRNGLIKHMNEQSRTCTSFIIRSGIMCWNNWVQRKTMAFIRLPKGGNIPQIKPAPSLDVYPLPWGME
tara:strand:- start:47 stop:976 length:930 start_codon:yes stop_codon:yes gene_type:complete